MERLRYTVLSILAVALAGCGGDVVTPDASTETPDAGPAACELDSECDDGLFCNGVERCLERCTAGTAPCASGERCDEGTDTCVVECADADGDGHAATACGGNDCDDADVDRFPGNVELCDALGHDEDCDETTFGDLDLDRDGFGDAACCNGTGATALCGEDCDDRRRTVHPEATDACDTIDNDCDGAIDEMVAIAGYWDEDLDGSGDAARPREGCPGSLRFAISPGDCNDDATRQSHLIPEVCDTVDNDCDGAIDENPRPMPWWLDDDHDRYASPADDDVIIACDPPSPYHVLILLDCDDTDVNRGPLVAEMCDGVDNNCNGWPDFFVGPFDYEDDDRDGVPDAGCGGGDCDDTNPTVRPGAPEREDGIDQDCDGIVDEGATTPTFYADVDGDGFGDPARTIEAATLPAGYAVQAGDCADDDVERNPDVSEDCDGVDDDCDARIDEGATNGSVYADADADGYGSSAGAVAVCLLTSGDPPAGFSRTADDCDDGDAGIHPAVTDLCNDVDDDCDGSADEDSPPYYRDVDGDGFAHDGAAVIGSACTAPPGHTAMRGDCNDASTTIYPGATELCDVVDQDCDGAFDDSSGPCPRMIYLTASRYSAASLGGIAGADALCNSDSSHPGGIYKAMLVSDLRRACVDAGCANGSDAIDWVFAPSTQYRRRDGAALFTTDANAVFLGTMANNIPPAGVNFWCGLSADWTTREAAALCGGWTADAGSGAVGWTGSLTTSWLTGGGWTCATATPLICVQQ